jgi:hypothetical protein
MPFYHLENPNFHTIVLIAAVLTIDPGALMSGIGKGSLPSKSRAFTAADFVRERTERGTQQ